jgi:hypothetical protein
MNNDFCIMVLNQYQSGVSVKDLAFQNGFKESKIYNCISKGRKLIRGDYIIRA